MNNRENTWPGDSLGDWFSDHLAMQAEEFYLRLFGKTVAKSFPPSSAPDVIRDNCWEIPRSQLTENEIEFLRPSLDAMLSRVKENLEIAQTKWRNAFRGTRPRSNPAPIVDEPVAYSVPENQDELLGRARVNLGMTA